jgi:hypothetical protein
VFTIIQPFRKFPGWYRAIASKFIFTKNERFYPTPAKGVLRITPPQGGELEKSSDFVHVADKIAAKKPFSPLPDSGRGWGMGKNHCKFN